MKFVKDRSFKEFLKEEKEKLKTIYNKFKDKKTVKDNVNDKDIDNMDKNKKEEKEKLVEENWKFKFNNFKSYIQKLKNMSKDEFVNDTLKFIKNDE